MTFLRNISRKLHGPRCHLKDDEKQWVEERMLWLRTQFGSGPIRRELLEPSSKLLPKKWDGSYEAGTDLVHCLCQFMMIETQRLRIEFYSRSETHEVESDCAGEFHYSGPAGLYIDPTEDGKRLVIALEESGLKQPSTLAATICHELGHIHLLAGRRIDPQEADCEPLTDLLTVYFGAGILNANSAFQYHQWSDPLSRQQGWNISRSGYLSEALFGYALACFAWFRGDLEAKWRKHLRDNIRYYFDDSMHFLETTRNTSVPFDAA